MAQDSKIELTHHTANLWWGCTKVHAGCNHCYAETLSKRYGKNVWGDKNPRMVVKSVWSELDKFQKLAQEAGEVHRVFVGSMMDIFEKPMPVMKSIQTEPIGTTEGIRKAFFTKVSSGYYPNLMFLLLTKRPYNINFFIPPHWKETPPDNVMFGCSISDQDTADRNIPHLLNVKGKKFLSVEPQIGFIDFSKVPTKSGKSWKDFDWIIQGGESGNIKRVFNLDWAYFMKQQCEIGCVPYFFKQIDKVQEIPTDLMVRQFPI
jgi:protein gp37